MSILLVKPTFNRLRQMITLPSASLNAYAREEIQDNFGFYQRTFGVFGYMQLNSENKFIIHTMSSTPFLWQPFRGCGWDPTGALFTGRREYEPCKAKINEQFCIDEVFNGCFKHLLRWNGVGFPDLGPDGTKIFNELVTLLVENATLGARLTLTVGQLFNPDAVTFAPKTPYEIRTLFTKTIGTCKGWLELIKEQALVAGFEHLNVFGIFQPGMFSGKTFTGNIVSVFDQLRQAATPEMQAMINEGGLATSLEGNARPLFLVSTSLYNKAAEDYRIQCISTTCLNPRLSRQEVTVQTPRGPRPQFVYYIDDVPIVPLSEIGQVDKYLTGVLHFAAITAAGNINLGASFGNIPDIETNNVGIMLQRETNIPNLGMVYFAAHSLFMTAIADTNYIVATQQYVVPV